MLYTLININSSDVLQAICRTFFHSIWQGIVAAAFAGLIVIFTRQSSARLRYNLLSGVFLFFIAGTVITFLKQLNFATGTDQQVSLLASPTLASGEVVNAAPVTDTTIPGSILQFCNDHAYTIMVVWLLVFLFKGFRMMAAIHGLKQLRTKNNADVPVEWVNRLDGLKSHFKIMSTVKLLESAMIRTPVVLGFLKPAILLPVGFFNNISTEQAEAILLHELAHIKRNDFLANFFQTMMECIFFFNPGLLWISSLIREEREACCDDLVMSVRGDKKLYVEALVSFQEMMLQPQLVMGIGQNKMALLQRIRRLMVGENKSLSIAEKLVLIVGIFVISAFTLMPRQLSSNMAIKPLTSAFVSIQGSTDTIPGKQIRIYQNYKPFSVEVEGSYDLHFSTGDEKGNSYLIIEKKGQSPQFFINGQRRAFAELKLRENLYLEYQVLRKQVQGGKKTLDLKPQAEKLNNKPGYSLEHHVTPSIIFSPTTEPSVLLNKHLALSIGALELKTTTPSLKIGSLEPKLQLKLDQTGELNHKMDLKLKLDTIHVKTTSALSFNKQSGKGKPVLSPADGSLQKFIADLVSEGVVAHADEVRMIRIDEDQLIINEKVQPAALHQKLKTKYGITQTIQVMVDGKDWKKEKPEQP